MFSVISLSISSVHPTATQIDNYHWSEIEGELHASSWEEMSICDISIKSMVGLSH